MSLARATRGERPWRQTPETPRDAWGAVPADLAMLADAFGLTVRTVYRRRRWPEWAAVADQSWRARALCRDGADAALWFDKRRARQAAAICARCPVRRLCGDYATATGQQFGMWGGRFRDGRRTVPPRQADR